jgi:hypothetical protein
MSRKVKIGFLKILSGFRDILYIVLKYTGWDKIDQ